MFFVLNNTLVEISRIYDNNNDLDFSIDFYQKNNQHSFEYKLQHSIAMTTANRIYGNKEIDKTIKEKIKKEFILWLIQYIFQYCQYKDLSVNQEDTIRLQLEIFNKFEEWGIF